MIDAKLKDKKELTWEHYFNKLIPILKQYIAVNSSTGEITTCVCMDCEDCLFRRATEDGYADCTELTIKWLLSPYKPFEKPPKLTREEYGFLKAVKVGYIARDENNDLNYYNEKVYAEAGLWYCLDEQAGFITIDQEMFPFIKWEDEEPWSVEELLKLEVEEC